MFVISHLVSITCDIPIMVQYGGLREVEVNVSLVVPLREWLVAPYILNSNGNLSLTNL